MIEGIKPDFSKFKKQHIKMGFNQAGNIIANILLLLVFMTLINSCKRDEMIYENNHDIIISTPKAQSVLEKGEFYQIKWQTEKAEKLRIELYLQNTPVRLISVSENNSGSYSWQVPDDIKPDTNYRIRITGIDNNQLSGFSHFFIISGDFGTKFINCSDFIFNNWVKGSDSLISWTDNIEEDVKIDLFLDGVFHSTIAQATPSNGNFLWSIPLALATSSNYSFKISSTVNPGIYNLSDVFRISLNSEINLVKNGNFINENFWNYSNPLTNLKNRWSINSELKTAEIISLQSSGSIFQELGLINGQKYIITYALSKYNGYIGGAKINPSDTFRAAIVCSIGTNSGENRYYEGIYTDTIIAAGSAIKFMIFEQASSFPNSGFSCKLDNIEVFAE
ncbi:MAG: hypothetical protein H0V01_03830 [Bacteroidetes bacterium]|nr:hypothetical protein [Bacteroidota bacterium]HET6243561.1 Ser-Thr-rich GPI-anchored membrane family protein [Bacteroidia bacterium]